MSALDTLLARIEALSKNATPGPWRFANGKGVASVKASDCAIYINLRTVEIDECVARWHRDAELIALSRTALPALAKMLKIAHQAMSERAGSGPLSQSLDAALSEIESIL